MLCGVLRLRQILQQAVTEAALLQLQGPSSRHSGVNGENKRRRGEVSEDLLILFTH